MEIDIPEVQTELRRAFAEYERAITTNDIVTLNRLFLAVATTVRFGSRGENQYSYDEIAAFRRTTAPAGLARTLARTRVTTYGTDFGVASTLYYRDDAPGKVGRQMQTWIRTPLGWRIVAAHVSLVDGPDRATP